MEDSKQRLLFDDFTVRTRCVQKLVQIIKKKSKGELITATVKQIPELTLLWETCLDSPAITTDFIIQGIVHLVIKRCIDTDYAINKLIGSMPSTSNAQALVKGISKIIIHEQKKKNEDNSFRCYSVHHPKHPLITVLQNDETYLPLILSSVADAVMEESYIGFQAMEPIISYILYNPVKRSNYWKVLLLETLIDAIQTRPKAAFYVLRCIPYLQIETCDQAAEASTFIFKAKLAFVELDLPADDRTYISELLLLASLSLSERCLILGHDPIRLLNLAYSVSSSFDKEHISVYVNVCLILIAITLKIASGKYLEKLISIALILLEWKSISSTVASFLAFSVIQLLPESSVVAFNEESSKSNLSLCLHRLEPYFLNNQNSCCSTEEKNTSDPKKEGKKSVLIDAFTFSVASSFLCAQFAQYIDESSFESKVGWLKSLKSHADSCAETDSLEMVLGIAVAMFLSAPDDSCYLGACLDAFDAILSKNTHLSTRIFSVLLYKQSLLKLPENKIQILSFLPTSAAHKYAIPPVISVLNQMSKNPELKAFSVHLMLQLWKKQDRIFSYLHKELLENSKITSKGSNTTKTLISQAAAIREICLMSPEKHGKDFAGTLSKIFNESNDEASSPAACLALDGVINLCKVEIFDIRSTWKLLGPRLSRDKRIPVVCRMYKLLSLIPDLQVNSPEFDSFMKEVVAKIWKLISSGSLSPEAERAAYQTLAKFPFDCHELKLIPAAGKVNLELPASMKATPFEMSKSPEDVLTYIPGYAFIDLLKNIDDDIVLEGFAEFLGSVLEQEISTLPRSAYNQRKHLQKRQNTNEVLLKVPKFLCSLMEMRKSPSLQKNLAVGVLLCYEPPLEIGKDGEPIKRSVAYQYRHYEQVLGVLLNEVNVDSTEWQRAILLPSAWGAFMERLFFASEDARKTELELQRNLGHLELTPEDFNLQCKTAWLWVRDRIMNLVKTCVKNAPTSHANAIYAVTGLVRAVYKYYSSLDDASKTVSDDTENFVKHELFLTECTETFLCAMRRDFQPSVKVHSWLLTHLSRPNSSSGYLIKGCSCASLYHLAPVLINSYGPDMSILVQDLLDYLVHSSPVLNFYSGIGLGFLIKVLCEIGFADSGETQAQFLLDSVKNIFNLYSNEESTSVSILISLTIAVCALSQIPNEDYKDWISTTCNILHEKLMEEEVSSMNFEPLSVCVSALMIAAADGSCVNVETMESLTNWFEEKQIELPQCSGTSVALGLLNDALERFGCSQAQLLKQKLQKEWFNTLSSEKKPTLHRLAALNGLCSLYSSGRGLLQVKSKVNRTNSMLNDVISLMFQLLTAARDTGLQNISSWEVGRLFYVHSFNQEHEELVPSSYHYLNEKSTLKYLMKTIIDSHSNDEIQIKQCHQLACLRALDREFSRPLPPLNWISVFTPLFQTKDLEVVETLLSVDIHQAKHSHHAASLLASYCCPPMVHSLSEKCWEILLKSIPDITLALPVSKLQAFYQTIILFVTKRDEKLTTIGEFLKQGILQSLNLTSLKQQSVKILQNAFISVFKHLKKDCTLITQHIAWICSGILCLPNKHVENTLCVAKNNSEIVILTHIWCHLVETGKRPLSSLRPCVEEGKHASPSDKESICSTICRCFLRGIHKDESEISKPEKCASWLLETIGWINILNDSKSQIQLLSVGEVFVFFNDICMATMIGCSGLECCYNFLTDSSISHQQLLENMPLAVRRLIKNDKWLAIMDKVIDWLLMLLQSPHMNSGDKHYIKLCLCSLRTLEEYQKTNVWTNIISSIC